MSDTLMISVSGIRGHVGTDLTPELVARYAAALGAWSLSRPPATTRSAGTRPADTRSAGTRSVVLGRDARTSGTMFARAATAGLMSVGVDVIDLGMVPTPTVQLAVEYHHAGAGLILTASHNPIEWNALKFVGPDGIFLDAEAGSVVGGLAEQGPPRAGWNRLGAVREDPGAIDRHLSAILALPVVDVEAIRKRGFNVALPELPPVMSLVLTKSTGRFAKRWLNAASPICFRQLRSAAGNAKSPRLPRACASANMSANFVVNGTGLPPLLYPATLP